MIGVDIAFLLVVVIALLIRLVVLARRISEQLMLRKPHVGISDDVTVKLVCDTSDFDQALKIATERAQILTRAFEAASGIGAKP